MRENGEVEYYRSTHCGIEKDRLSGYEKGVCYQS